MTDKLVHPLNSWALSVVTDEKYLNAEKSVILVLPLNAVPIDVTISASDLCEILKEQFTGDFTFSGVTGENIAWQDNGYVDKAAIKYVLKEAN